MAKSDYVAADEDKLDEILKQAESRLGSQLAIALAADQRAMTFAGILIAIAAALLAWGTDKGLAWPVIGMIGTLILGAASAAWAASPIAWETWGTSPSDWIADIAEGKDDLLSAKAAMANFYGEMIDANIGRLEGNATYVRISLCAAILTPVVGAVLTLVG